MYISCQPYQNLESGYISSGPGAKTSTKSPQGVSLCQRPLRLADGYGSYSDIMAVHVKLVNWSIASRRALYVLGLVAAQARFR